VLRKSRIGSQKQMFQGDATSEPFAAPFSKRNVSKYSRSWRPKYEIGSKPRSLVSSSFIAENDQKTVMVYFSPGKYIFPGIDPFL